MIDQTMLVAHILFYVLVCATIFLPIRWSVVAYLLLAQVDLTGVASYAAESLGIENPIKIIVVPTILLYRLWPFDMDPGYAKLRQTWLLFSSYAAVAVLWSPYKLSALKMLGYFYAYSVLFLVFTAAWQRKWFTAKALTLVVWSCILFAVIQTYALGNPYGSFVSHSPLVESESRFTGFIGAQSLAAFLLSMLVLLLFRERWSLSVIAAGMACAIAMVLTGSRSVFLGFGWVLLIGAIVFSLRRDRKVTLRKVVTRIIFTGAAVLSIGALVLTTLPENRLNQLFSTLVTRDASLEDVGTFIWRFALYQKTLTELAGRSLPALAVGSGTSSAANVSLEGGFTADQNVDRNRALHDEFLRCLYEWGMPGLVLLVLFLASGVMTCLRMIKQHDSVDAWAFLAVAVPMLISLAVENFLADAASPGGVGYNLALTAMLASGTLRQEQRVMLSINSSRWTLLGNNNDAAWTRS